MINWLRINLFSSYAYGPMVKLTIESKEKNEKIRNGIFFNQQKNNAKLHIVKPGNERVMIKRRKIADL